MEQIKTNILAAIFEELDKAEPKYDKISWDKLEITKSAFIKALKELQTNGLISGVVFAGKDEQIIPILNAVKIEDEGIDYLGTRLNLIEVFS